jgi:D-alanyl-lipoteichoic acid acyltransferase DltB (MBOAT superfamily)
VLFNSTEFLLVFLPVLAAVLFVLNKLGLRSWWAFALLVASLVFYGAWSVRYLPLLIASIGFNFVCGHRLMARPSKGLLGLAIVGDLLALGYYKYTDFGLSVLQQATGFPASIPQIVLPLGISFFTFTQIAFLVDAYRGRVSDRDPVNYGLFVTFFPHLIAGPILHHKEMTSQFRALPGRGIDASDIAVGATLFAMGWFKKVVVADYFGPNASLVFDAAAAGQPLGAGMAWMGALSYALQLYFDFSGYTDMAIGLARGIGIRMPANFNSPYKAVSIADFWRRWHMTLSRFLRDYLYVPLGGNRHGPARSALNAFITMVLGGIWHGAGWNFMLWGAMHGAFIVINRAWSALGARLGFQTPRLVAVAVTFLAVVLAWVPFRAYDLGATVEMYQSLAGLNGVGRIPLTRMGAAVLAIAAVWLLPNSQSILAAYSPILPTYSQSDEPTRWTWKLTPVHGVILGGLVATCILFANEISEFLYFRF